MEHVFGKLLPLLFAAAIGLVFAAVTLSIRISRNARNWPDADGKRNLIIQIREWKRSGLSYRQRRGLLSAQGLRKDVADVLLGEAKRSACMTSNQKARSR